MPLTAFDFNNFQFIARIYVHFKVLYYLPLVKTGYGLQVFQASRFITKKRETTKPDKEPIKEPPGYQESTRTTPESTMPRAVYCAYKL